MLGLGATEVDSETGVVMGGATGIAKNPVMLLLLLGNKKQPPATQSAAGGVLDKLDVDVDVNGLAQTRCFISC